ncbi:HEPN domain-containing protein [Cytobacillus praedii]|uniref:Uncharacterized protein n=1 Tax=Cytobacillus praedii TaxID=1742358 RepID=A0A4R1ATN7_9BACI|nr:HEPN domain-containing protein [Cytobacillus praedii]TCJ01329.1 hypothetical protein E0Y62_24445 [Cytobacillus praedii]
MKEYTFKTVVKSSITFLPEWSELVLGTVSFSIQSEYRANQPYMVQVPSDDTGQINGNFRLEKEVNKPSFVPLHAKTIVYAINEEEAFQKGLQKINSYLDIISLITKTTINIATTGECYTKDGVRDRMFSAKIANVSLANEKIKEITYNLLKYMTWLPEDTKNRVLKGIRFYRKAMLEEQFDAEYLLLWISLEVLGGTLRGNSYYPVCKVCANEIRECKHCGTDTKYNPSEKTLIKELLVRELSLVSGNKFNQWYKSRSSLVHSGNSINNDDIDTIKKHTAEIKELIPKVIDLILEKNMLKEQIKDEEELFYWGFSKPKD